MSSPTAPIGKDTRACSCQDVPITIRSAEAFLSTLAKEDGFGERIARIVKITSDIFESDPESPSSITLEHELREDESTLTERTDRLALFLLELVSLLEKATQNQDTCDSHLAHLHALLPQVEADFEIKERKTSSQA